VKLSSRTWLLLVVALVLLLANVLDLGAGRQQAEQLPSLVALDAAKVSRIELSDAVTKVVLVPRDPAAGATLSDAAPSQAAGGWRLLAPVQAPADEPTVRAVLSAFHTAVPVDVRVDQGNLETYGLEAGKGVVVELWSGGDLPVISFTVGNDAPGGSSFIRLSGDDAIYRARVGGRARYQPDLALWRKREPLGVERSQVAQVQVDRSDGQHVVMVRRPAPAGPWTLDPAPAWPVDTDAIDAMVQRLGAVRADEVLDGSFAGGFDPPLATITLTLVDGSIRVVRVGNRAYRDAAFLQVEGDPVVYRVQRQDVIPLLRSAEDLRDKTLLAFAAADVDTLSLQEQGRTWMVRQVGGTGHWEVVQPANVDLDVGRVAVAAQALAALRGDLVVEGLGPAQAGLDRPADVVSVLLVDGSQLDLEIGGAASFPDGQPARYVRARGRPGIMLLRATTVQTILEAFGRAG